MTYTAVTRGVHPSKPGLIFKQKSDDQKRVTKILVMMMMMMATRRLQAAPMSPII